MDRNPQYFKNGYGAELKSDPAEALHVSSGLLTLLDTEPNETLRARREGLQAARDKLVAAVAAHSTAVDLVQNERKRLAEQSVAWGNAYLKFYFDSRHTLPSLRDKIEKWFEQKATSPSEDDQDRPADDDDAGSGTATGTTPAPGPQTVPGSTAGASAGSSAAGPSSPSGQTSPSGPASPAPGPVTES